MEGYTENQGEKSRNMTDSLTIVLCSIIEYFSHLSVTIALKDCTFETYIFLHSVEGMHILEVCSKLIASE